MAIGLVAGVVMALAGGVRRIETAPDRYTNSVGGELAFRVNQPFGPPLTDRIRSVAGIVDVKASTFITAFLVAPDGSLRREPNAFAGDETIAGARIVAGRFARTNAPNEFTVNRLFFTDLNAKIGDQFEVAASSVAQVQANDGQSEPEVPRFRATLVGVTESPADFDLPVPQLVFPRSFLDAHQDVGLIATSMDVRVDSAVSRNVVEAQVKPLAESVGASIVAARIVSPDARRSVRFLGTALEIISFVAGISVAFLVLQVSTRLLNVSTNERSSLAALGIVRVDLAVERLVECAVVAVLASVMAIVVAVALSPLFPLGALRTFEPDQGVRIDPTVLLTGAAALLVVLVASAFIAVRGPRTFASAGVSKAHTVVARNAGVERTAAARMTFQAGGTRRAITRFLVPGAFCVAGVVASLIVGLSVSRTVDHPVRWGADYDQLFGDPYSPAQRNLADPLKNDPDIEALALATTGPLTINGRTITVFATEMIRGTTGPVMVEGQRPKTVNEIAFGAESARRLGVTVGDTVTALGSSKAAVELRVTGLVTTPDTAGNGASMTFAAYHAVEPTASKNLMLVKYRNGAMSTASARIAKSIYTPVGAVPTPTSVSALAKVLPAPTVLATVLIVLAALAAGLHFVSSVRRHRRDLSVLVALGSTPKQVRSVVYLHAALVSGLSALVGLPVGLLAGHRIVDSMFDSLGVVRGAFIPFPILVAILVGAVGGALLLASTPARSAWSMQALRESNERP